MPFKEAESSVHPEKVGDRTQLLRFVFVLANYLTMSYLVVMLFLESEEKTFIGAVFCFTNILAQLHVILYIIALYMLRPNILYLLKSIQQRFWQIEDCSNSQIRRDCYQTLHVLKWKYKIFCTLLSLCILTYYYGRILESRKTVPENMMFESYIPKWMNFWVMFAWQHLPAYGFPVIELAMDFTVFSIVSLTAIQFKLLRYEMGEIFKDTKDGILPMDKLRKCDDHLSFLLSFRYMVNNTFSSVVFLYLGIITLIICMEIYFISIMESVEDILRAVVYAALMFFEFFMCYCFPAQSLVDESQKIASTFFDSGWYNYIRFNRSTIILLGKTQLQVNFTVGGFFNLNLQTGLAMAKSMFSYSMFLRTITILKEEL